MLKVCCVEFHGDISIFVLIIPYYSNFPNYFYHCYCFYFCIRLFFVSLCCLVPLFIQHILPNAANSSPGLMDRQGWVHGRSVLTQLCRQFRNTDNCQVNQGMNELLQTQKNVSQKNKLK